METPSQLESFLSLQESEGELVSSASDFTLAVEAALRKIAEFQLPFENAWAVKVVQSAVADGESQPVRVDLTSMEAQFFFLTRSITIDDVEQAFFNPEPSPNRALSHLISGLWASGVKNGVPFQLMFAGDTECLIWDGKKLHRAEAHEKRTCTYLAVSTCRSKGKLGWIKEMAKSAEKNAEILRTLARWSYACPVPLTVDGRRVDSLFNCPSHGLGATQFPLFSGFVDGLNPRLPIPPGTFQKSSIVQDPRAPRSTYLAVLEGGDIPGLYRNAQSLPDRTAVTDMAGAAFILSTFWHWVGQGKSRKLQPAQQSSQICWVLDGTVVETEELAAGRCHCSAVIFVNAEGLSTDLTSFRLKRSPERTRRRQEAVAALADRLGTVDELQANLDEVVSGIRTGGRWLGGVFFCIGLVALTASPLHGIAFAGGGIGTALSLASKAKDTSEHLRRSVEELRTELKKSV